MGGGSTLGRGDAVAYALAGWPQETVGYLSGLSDDVDVGAELFWQVPRANFEAAALLRYRLASRGRLDVAARGRVGFFVNLGGHGFERRNRDALGPVIGPGLALSYRAGARDLLYAGLDIPVGLGLDPAALHVPVLGSAGFEHELAKGLVDGKPLCVGLGTELGPWAVTRPDKLFFYWSAALRLTQAL